MDILLYRPLITIRNHNRYKVRVDEEGSSGSLWKVFIQGIKNISHINIIQDSIIFAGKGSGPAFERERKYLQSILPEVTFSSSYCRRNFIKRFFYSVSILIYIAPLYPRLIKLVYRFAKNNHLTNWDTEKYILFLFDFFAYKYFFTKNKTKAKGVITHALLSPRGLSLITAAIKENIPSIFILHGACTPSYQGIIYPTFPVDLHLLKSKASQDRMNIKASRAKQIAYYGLPGDEKPLRSVPEIIKSFGICLPYGISKDVLDHLIDDIQKNFQPQQVNIRFHPRDQLRHNYQKSGIIISSSYETVQDFANNCDLIVAGNTSAILDILKIGCPVIYLDSMDTFGTDVYGFSDMRLIPEFKAINDISLDLCNIVYLDRNWPTVMSYFDSSYDKDRVLVNQNIKESIYSVLNL